MLARKLRDDGHQRNHNNAKIKLIAPKHERNPVYTVKQNNCCHTTQRSYNDGAIDDQAVHRGRPTNRGASFHEIKTGGEPCL
eukprot:4264014-Pyramimonas_sp.AAC.1